MLALSRHQPSIALDRLRRSTAPMVSSSMRIRRGSGARRRGWRRARRAPEIWRKVAHISSDSFFNQLLIAALGPFSALAVRNTFSGGVGEDHGAHVAAVGDQAGRPAEARCAPSSAWRTAGSARDFGGAVADLFGAERLAHVVVAEPALRRRRRRRASVLGERGERALVVESMPARSARARSAGTARRSRGSGSRARRRPRPRACPCRRRSGRRSRSPGSRVSRGDRETSASK